MGKSDSDALEHRLKGGIFSYLQKIYPIFIEFVVSFGMVDPRLFMSYGLERSWYSFNAVGEKTKA
jgi:hypothetical protein